MEHIPTRYPGTVSNTGAPRSHPTSLNLCDIGVKDMPISSSVSLTISSSACWDGLFELSAPPLGQRWRISLARTRACIHDLSCSSGLTFSLRHIVTRRFWTSYHNRCFSFWNTFASSVRLTPFSPSSLHSGDWRSERISAVNLTPISAFPRTLDPPHLKTPSLSNIRSRCAACRGVNISPVSRKAEQTTLVLWRFKVRSATAVTALKLVPRWTARRSVKDNHVAHVDEMCDTTKLPAYTGDFMEQEITVRPVKSKHNKASQ